MHSSADSAVGLRERRKQQVSAQLTDAARRSTAQSGLHGFTVDELCDEVGVSRRTFFNYFGSKEDAVLGIPAEYDDTELTEAFLAGGDGAARGATDPLSPTLLDDFVALLIARWESLDMTRHDNARDLFDAVDREPKLLTRMLGISREREQADVALVERREGLEPGDIRGTTLVHLVASLARACGADVLAGTSPFPFTELLGRRIGAARELLIPSSSTTPR
jgi:AcrR family transcriptional regulator